VKDPSAYSRHAHHGAAKYVKNVTIDKKTGEMLEDVGKVTMLDTELIVSEEELDSYYVFRLKPQEHEIKRDQGGTDPSSGRYAQRLIPPERNSTENQKIGRFICWFPRNPQFGLRKRYDTLSL
jgi:hypothetical protein